MLPWLRETWLRWTARRGIRTLASAPSGITLRVSYGPGRAERTDQLRWSDIRRLRVYKRDLLTHDLICLAVELSDDRTFELHERDEGWRAVVEAIPAHLAGALPEDEWYPRVAKPAFEACETPIFERAG